MVILVRIVEHRCCATAALRQLAATFGGVWPSRDRYRLPAFLFYCMRFVAIFLLRIFSIFCLYQIENNILQPAALGQSHAWFGLVNAASIPLRKPPTQKNCCLDSPQVVGSC